MGKFRFTNHARLKFRILREHGFLISEKQVVDTVKNAERREKGKGGRTISQKRISEEHVLRVVHEKAGKNIIIITFYPGRRGYYESKL